jgi:SAM-dependent methyltransferase
VHAEIGDAFAVPLPSDHFDGVFVSNFLEHLPTQEHVADLLGRLRSSMRPGGRIAVMGPNFRYCAKEYFDCADHVLALTHVAVQEHLAAAGFEIERVVPRFLPYSFRGLLPPSRALTRLYLRLPAAWLVLGKQFIVIGRRPA